MILALLFAVAVWAGIQNALAGGGSFVTLPALIVSGLDARAANIASTLALFPGQVTTGWVGRAHVSGAGGLSFRALTIISLAGGAVGAVLLLETPSAFFARLVPWLVLFATALFAWGSFRPRKAPAPEQSPTSPVAAANGGGGPSADPGLEPGVEPMVEGASRERGASTTPNHRLWITGAIQFGISVYGGYFGGGIGFLMLAALTAAGLAVRRAGATKNVLAAAMNAAAVAVFVFTPHIPWLRVGVVCAGAIGGGYAGAHLLQRVDERWIRGFVVVLGVALTVGLFWRAGR
jgi:uncharacterized membrane protein YfcA